MKYEPESDVFEHTIAGFDDSDLDGIAFGVRHDGVSVIEGEGDYVEFAGTIGDVGDAWRARGCDLDSWLTQFDSEIPDHNIDR
ncbi:MAG: hypothetical protein GY804_04040 [Alphaproteobacteria bacterium]|nr:hypothetical protein [Alphaproteobacteria bacterium]